ncbi:MAG: restriction endonuclease subunit S [Bacteroidaceae bacterium]|nr:restriction endonuclease subunit S [Bacteroidaceae bacterium]
MTSTYKRIGDYIREVDVRNRDLSVTTLLGVSISKEFILSIANTIGTDMSTYKIVRKGQFAYGPVTSRNGDKVSIALLANEDTAIISQAYTVFEVKDTNELLPEYLMMWFSRPEFDRYARFHSHGSAREIFDWPEMCDVMLPIPSIERQREIVAEYETLSKRIRINEQMISTLEATAQTLYCKMFVDGIDKENLPDGWRMGALTDIATYLNGIACQKFESNSSKYLPVLKIRELSQGYCDMNSDHVDVSIPGEYIIMQGDIIFSWSATLFIDIWADEKCALNQHLFKISSNRYPKWFYFLWTKSHIEEWKRLISAKATSMGHIKREDLDSAKVIIPSDSDLKRMDKKFNPLFEMLTFKKRENLQLKKLQSLLLAKMGQ